LKTQQRRDTKCQPKPKPQSRYWNWH
jgi:hypothetical protein